MKEVPENKDESQKVEMLTVTEAFVFTILKNDGKDSESFKKVVKRYFDQCDIEADLDAKNLKEQGVRDATVLARTKVFIKKIKMQIKLYEKGLSICTADDILDSLYNEESKVRQLRSLESLKDEILKIADNFEESLQRI